MEAVTKATAPVREPIIEIKGLSLAFEQNGVRTEVLHNLNLDVAPGEFLALVGASGVGKSTLLRVLMGLAQPTAGEVHVRPDPNADRPMALVFQDSRLLPWRRVISNVAFGLEKTSLDKPARLARAMEALKLVGLADLADRWPWQLSGGQRQRVSLARALAVRPSILLMDEPFSALDVGTRENLQDELIRIREKTGKTIIFVTHDIDEAVYLADRIVALAGKPGEAKAIRPVEIERPRKRFSLSVQEMAAKVRADITPESAPRADDWVI
jgi:NitT/TauT family transport system ATP-binding protein